MRILPHRSVAQPIPGRAIFSRWPGSEKRQTKAWPRRAGASLAVAVALSILSGCAITESTRLPWNASTSQDSGKVEGRQRKDAERAQNRALVERTQSLLNGLGYEAGPADGVAGPKTREAVRAYQRNSGLAVDGRISTNLLRRLESSKQTAEPKPGPELSAMAPATESEPDMQIGDPPLYEAGSTYVYSDGHVDIVVGLKGDTVRWRRNDGTKFTTHRNFLLPWIYWQSEAGSGKWSVEGQPWSLWPRGVDQEIAYSATVVEQRAGGTGSLTRSAEAWRCRWAGRKQVTVVAGTFDTVKLVCERAATKWTPAQSRVWYYAPSIQHYVRLEDRGTGATAGKQTELVTIRPGGKGWPPIARAALSRAVEQALETVSNGQATPWRSSGVDTRVTIEPTSRFRSGEGRLCRTFLQTWSDSGGRRSYPGAACRDDMGRWWIPGLGDGSEGELAISNELS